MRLLFFILMLAFSNTVFSQKMDTIRLKTNYPIRDGYTVLNSNFNNPVGMMLHSFNQEVDSVFSVSEGIVSSVGEIENEFYCIIKSADFYWSYAALRDCPVKKGNVIHKGMFIGLMVSEANDKYFHFVVSDLTGILDFKDQLRILNRAY